MKVFNSNKFVKPMNHFPRFVFLIPIALFLNACSSAYGPVNPQPRRSLPVIPEITYSKPIVRKPAMKVTSSKRQVKSVYKPKVKKYSVSKPAKPALTKEERVKTAQKAATVEFDPYAVVPDNSSSKISTSSAKKPLINTAKTSPAVTSLMLQAKGELAIGNAKSAVSKIERALRIESQNPKLWNLLAQANFDQSSYQQAISMAKKSIRYTRNDDLISKNWKLIQKAGESSGDTVVAKEALNYFKVNP